MGKKNSTRQVFSRRGRNFIITSIVCFLILLSIADRIYLKKYIEKSSPQKRSLSDVDKYHLKKFAVVKVVDGDTVDINVSDGEYSNTRVRLLGVDTPETKNSRWGEMYFGREASEKVKELVLGEEVMVLVDTVSVSRDKYGRLLCYLKLEDGTILNEYLVAEGLGYADSRFDHSFYKKYLSLQKKARKEKMGLWENVKFENMPGWMQKTDNRL